MEPFRKLICAVMMLGAAAASAEDAGVYFALSGGVSKLELDPKIDDDDPWNATFIAGYRVNPHFALEAGYKHIDEVT